MIRINWEREIQRNDRSLTIEESVHSDQPWKKEHLVKTSKQTKNPKPLSRIGGKQKFFLQVKGRYFISGSLRSNGSHYREIILIFRLKIKVNIVVSNVKV